MPVFMKKKANYQKNFSIILQRYDMKRFNTPVKSKNFFTEKFSFLLAKKTIPKKCLRKRKRICLR